MSFSSLERGELIGSNFYKPVIPNAKRSGVSDLEARFGGCELRALKKSGFQITCFASLHACLE
jgi:hypothetical protein